MRYPLQIKVMPVTNARYEPLYGTWRVMLHRCYNPRNKKYKDYGSRGITVCDRWMDFNSFKSDMGERPYSYLLERKNNNGNYEPNNCIWATPKQQNRNKRSVKYLGLAETIFQLRAAGIQRKEIVALTGANVATVKAIIARHQWI
jgi:hypothetical protein